MGDITAKSDQEPAMKAGANEVARHRAAAGGGMLVQEHSPLGDSKGNGIIERAVKAVDAQACVARCALKSRSRIKGRLDPDQPVFTWMKSTRR